MLGVQLLYDNIFYIPGHLKIPQKIFGKSATTLKSQKFPLKFFKPSNRKGLR